MSEEVEHAEEWTDERLQKEFPAIYLAYDIAIKSYDVSRAQADKLDVKIHSIAALSAAITVGLTVAASNLDLPLNSWCLQALLILFGCDTLLFLGGRFVIARGNVFALSPKKLFDENLDTEKWTFMRDRIYFAAQAFEETSKKLLVPRWWVALILSISLVLKVWVFLVWVWVSAHPSPHRAPNPGKAVEEADYFYLMVEQMIPSLPL